LLKERQDLVRNNAADNIRELQAKVGKQTVTSGKKRVSVNTSGAKGVGVSKSGRELQAKVGKQTTEKASGKKWAPVNTSGAKGVGVSKSGYSTKPVRLPGMAKRPSVPLPSGLKKGGFKMGGLKGLGAGVIGSSIAGVLKQNRKEKDQDFWGTYDNIVSGLTMGVSVVNPVAGALVAPVMEVFGQWGNSLVDKGYNPLGMPGEFDFYEDWATFRKNPANDGVSLPEYQRRRRAAEEELKKKCPTNTATNNLTPGTSTETTNLTPGSIPGM
jgi:hypothetical protein